MKFSYCYKTSDGIRREETIESPSREATFQTLRSMGIRPIKVVSLEGSKANGEVTYVTRKRFILLSLVGGIAVGVSAVLFVILSDFRSPELIELENQAEGIRQRHDKMVATLHLDALRDYQSISSLGDTWILNEKISVGHHDLKVMRQEIRDLFRQNAKVVGAKELYHRTMDAIDLTEFQLLNDERAFRLLDANRGKWAIKDHRIVWSDSSLASEFAAFSRDLGSDTLVGD